MNPPNRIISEKIRVAIKRSPSWRIQSQIVATINWNKIAFMDWANTLDRNKELRALEFSIGRIKIIRMFTLLKHERNWQQTLIYSPSLVLQIHFAYKFKWSPIKNHFYISSYRHLPSPRPPLARVRFLMMLVLWLYFLPITILFLVNYIIMELHANEFPPQEPQCSNIDFRVSIIY